MAQLVLSLLGPFQATLNDKPIRGFESIRVRALLAYLVVEKAHPHQREALVELLWPALPRGAGAADLRHTLANLRKAIDDQHADPPFLLITPTTLQFNAASAAESDFDRFYTLLRGHDPTPAAQQEALALYRGSFLEGFTLDESPEFELWLTVQRERVNALVAQALTSLVNDAVQQGDFAQAVCWTERQLALDTLNEDLYAQLIWLLAHSGQRAAALRYFDLCRQVLEKELGVEPQAGLEALVERIRHGAPDLGLVYGQDGQTLVAPLPATHLLHLPTPPTPFFGRKQELALVAAHLADPACRLLTIVGPGGIGKTRLAIEAAAAAQEQFAQGIYFVELVAVATVDQIPNAILSALEAPRYGALESRRQLLDYLRPRHLLLLLDNFEHLLAATDWLIELIQHAPLVKVLVTSRTRLNLRQEWLIPLEGLALPPAAVSPSLPGPPPAASVADLEQYESLHFFLRCARRLQPTLQPSSADAAAILRICQLLEGMPLGIELAATWVRSLSLPAIADEIEQGQRFLTTSLRDMPSRHHSMSAVFDHSWRLLSPRERSILRQLAVFHGGCTRAAAEAVSGATATALAELVDKSWLRLRTDERYQMHELVRQYCQEKLATEHAQLAGESGDEVRSRHCAYFAGMTGSQEEQAYNWQAESMALLRADFGNLEAAWHWSLAQEETTATQQMMNALFYFAEMTGWFATMLPFFEKATALLRARRQATGADVVRRQNETSLQISLLYVLIVLLHHLGRLTAAQSYLDAMHALLADIADDAPYPYTLARMATLAQAQARGDFAEAQSMACDLLAFLEQNSFPCYPWRSAIGTRFFQMQMHASIGLSARLLGDYVTAWRHSERAVQLSDEMGEQRFKANTLQEMAVLWRLRGEYDQAHTVAQRGLELSRRFEDRIIAAYGELTLGEIACNAGQLVLAAEYCRRSLAVALETGEHRLHIFSLATLAHIERRLGHLVTAHNRLDEAASACMQPAVAPSIFLSVVAIECGHLACTEGDWAAAYQSYTQALACKGCEANAVQQAYVGLAEVAWAKDDPARALPLLSQVIANPATAVATRRRAQQLLAQWEA